MVVPVPEVLEESDVVTLDADVFERVDRLAAPRLVEYWERDPCAEDDPMAALGALMGDQIGSNFGFGGLGLRGTGGVTVEAEFAVGEYEIVILSARDSSGLESWLRAHRYAIPDGAEAALRPYVEAGTKFFVAKVDVSKVTFEDGRAVLSPLRIHYESETFSLPVRLGMLNSSGTQDLLVHVLATERYELANYENVTVPTNLDLQDSVRERFGEAYAAIFDRTLERNPGAVVTEYAWPATNCDPCPGGGSGLSPTDLRSLGWGAVPVRRTTRWRSRVRMRQVDVRGDLDPEVVRRVVRGRSHELEFCHHEYTRAPRESADAELALRWIISPTGRVQTAVVVESSGNPQLDGCAAQALRRWDFPAPRGGGIAVATAPLKFEALPGASTIELPPDATPNLVLTRMHHRYETGGLGEDLVFRRAEAIVGGREIRELDGTLSQGASAAEQNNFQARYAIRHEWEGPIDCAIPVRGRWGGPPRDLAHLTGLRDARTDRGPIAAQDLAHVPRGEFALTAALAVPAPALGVGEVEPAPPADTPPQPEAPAEEGSRQDRAPGAPSGATESGCGCTSASPLGGATCVLVFLLARRRRRG